MNTIDLARAASRFLATTRHLVPVLAFAMATTGCAMDGEDGNEESDPSGEETDLEERGEVEEDSPDTERDEASDPVEPDATEESDHPIGRLERVRGFVHPEEEVTGEIDGMLPMPNPKDHMGSNGVARGIAGARATDS